VRIGRFVPNQTKILTNRLAVGSIRRIFNYEGGSEISESFVKNRVGVLLAEKEKQEGRRITHREIERDSGIPNSVVSTYVTHKVRNYNAKTLFLFCRYFDCGIDDILEVPQG